MATPRLPSQPAARLRQARLLWAGGAAEAVPWVPGNNPYHTKFKFNYIYNKKNPTCLVWYITLSCHLTPLLWLLWFGPWAMVGGSYLETLDQYSLYIFFVNSIHKILWKDLIVKQGSLIWADSKRELSSSRQLITNFIGEVISKWGQSIYCLSLTD